jgi:uncharacterized membrane protein YhaH (DUF805 family)
VIRSIKQTISETLNYGGRSKRSDYWYYLVFILLSIVIISTIVLFLGLTPEDPLFTQVSFFTGTLLIIPNIALTVRRAHDFGVTGWIAMPIFVIGFIGTYQETFGILDWAGLALSTVVGLMPGHKGPNKYGAAPA